MAINRIKALKFKNLKPTEKEQLIPDGGNLYIRVRPVNQGGSISFRFFYRFEGKQKWLTLKADNLPAARAERDSYTQMLKEGIDPNLEAKLKIERAKQQQLAEQEAITKLAARVTVRDLFVRWRDTDLLKRKDVKEIIRMFEKDVLPVLGGLFVEDVRKGHITQVIDLLKQRDAVHSARNILKLMRQMFRFAVDRDIIEFDPTASLSVVRLTTAPTERDRTLSETEIRALARQMPDANFMQSTECAVWIALSTMCRIGELSKAQWCDVNFEAKTWTIPESNSKNGKAHTIYLSDFALEQFKRLATTRQTDTWIFPNRDNSSHVCDKSIGIQIRGRQTATILSGRSKDSQALVLTGGKWTSHDLRRTGATLMGDLGISPDVIEKCLNHTEENKVKRIYQRQELKAEQAEAWKKLGDRLNLLVNMDGSNVVLLHNKAG
ncbi:tyrosine-type recombinase/integrase [Methylocucumis oryzae]|uniref:Integrase n=1 Tax=Methylocucumis oryzae TaxID=1632867 RepID=A0A0F3ILN0_9GAMM|nr:site-specific integrase [Methylocucumis oryzae]KJV07552.1 integrase [Methylocucumis oryzae]